MKMRKSWKYTIAGAAAAVMLCTNAFAENITIKTSVNVRSEPDNHASVVCTLPKGAEAEKLDTVGNWYEIRYKGKSGYVYRTFIHDKTAAAGTKTMYVTASSLNVRAEPKTTAKKLGTLKKDTAVQVKATKDGWCTIPYNGKNGYISAEYVTETKPTTSTTTTSTTTVYTTANLNVRATAGNNGERLGSIKKGAAVKTYGKINGWYQIKYNNKTAYISAQYTTTKKPS